MGHKAKIGDLLPLDTKTLQWDPGNPAAFVGALADAVGGEAEKAIPWYLEKKDGQRLLSRTFRVAAIVLVMAAALLPILGEIFKTEGRSSIWLSPGWASVALVLAATLLVLDRFYGCSSSWMRFMATEMQIREALHVFRMDFHILRTDWPGGKPSENQVREGLERCRAFLAQLDGLLRAELDAWVQEFRTSLKDIDEMVKLRSEAAKAAANTAAINVVVENGDKCEHGWMLSVDGGTAQARRGQTAVVTGLLPGIHSIKIFGRIGGKEVTAEKSVNVAAGATPEVQVVLAPAGN